MDMILLYIDNCEPALNGVLEVVAHYIHQPEHVRVLWTRDFVLTKAEGIMSRHGDRVQAECLRKELRKVRKSRDYWPEVYKHYHQKHLELTQVS